MGVNLLQLSIA